MVVNLFPTSWPNSLSLVRHAKCPKLSTCQIYLPNHLIVGRQCIFVIFRCLCALLFYVLQLHNTSVTRPPGNCVFVCNIDVMYFMNRRRQLLRFCLFIEFFWLVALYCYNAKLSNSYFPSNITLYKYVSKSSNVL